MILKEGALTLDFTGFQWAEDFDTEENQCCGLKLVDFVAQSNDHILFVEVKNYDNVSEIPRKQAGMNKRKAIDYAMLTDPHAAFPLETGMVFKDSLLRWLATGKAFTKPIKLLFLINEMPEFEPQDRLKLIERVEGYIPTGMHTKLAQYPQMQAVSFAMPTLAETKPLYGFTTTLTQPKETQTP